MLNNYVNKITCGDCYKLIKELPDKSIDCIYTDIPYLFDKGGCGSSEISLRMAKIHKDELKKETDLVDGIDYTIFYDFVRVMRKINCFIWCSKLQIYPVLDWFMKNTDCTYQILTWNKTNPVPMCNGTWLSDIEYCLYFNRGTKLNDGIEHKSKWYTSALNVKDKLLFNHPTIKPLELVKRHLLHTTQPNDIVLDPFCGSGTTCLSCEELGRQYIGFEISEKWCKVANDKLNKIDAKGQLCMFAR